MGRRLLQATLLFQCLALTAGCASSGGEAALPAEVPRAREDAGAGARAGPDTGLPEPGETSQLADYLAYAALNNPGLEAAFNRWKAALERVPQERALPDPHLTYRRYVLKMNTEQALGIEQMFPWFGKLRLAGTVALEQAEAERERFRWEKLKLQNRVKNAYYEYYYLGRQLEVVKGNRELMKYFEDVARTKYRVGKGAQQDILRAQVELGKLDDQFRTLTDMVEPTLARLNASLNRPPSTPIAMPQAVPEETIDAEGDGLLALVSQNNPELKAMEHAIAAEKESIALARKQSYPDITVGGEFMDGRGGGDDELAIMAGLNLPIWVGKYRAGVREAQARHLAAVKARADRENMLFSDIKVVLYQFRDAERRIGLYKDTLLPIAKQSLKTTETSFAAGTSDFLDVVDAERVYLDLQLSYERALADRAQRLADIEMLVGQELPRRKPGTQVETKPGEKVSPPESEEKKEPGAQEQPPETKPENEGKEGAREGDATAKPEEK